MPVLELERYSFEEVLFYVPAERPSDWILGLGTVIRRETNEEKYEAYVQRVDHLLDFRWLDNAGSRT